MKRILMHIGLSIALALAVLSPAAIAQHSREHRAAMRLCKQKYRDAVRGAKYLRGHARRERIAQARRDRADCEKLAPR